MVTKLEKRMTKESVVSELLSEIEGQALHGLEPNVDPRAMLRSIVKVAFLTQDVNRGYLTPEYRFNEHLLMLLGEENLN